MEGEGGLCSGSGRKQIGRAGWRPARPRRAWALAWRGLQFVVLQNEKSTKTPCVASGRRVSTHSCALGRFKIFMLHLEQQDTHSQFTSRSRPVRRAVSCDL